MFAPSVWMRTNWSVFPPLSRTICGPAERFADRRRATRITAAVLVKPGRAHQAVRRILQGWIPLNSSWRFETAPWRTQFVRRVIDQWLWIG